MTPTSGAFCCTSVSKILRIIMAAVMRDSGLFAFEDDQVKDGHVCEEEIVFDLRSIRCWMWMLLAVLVEVEDWEPTSPKAKDVLGTDGYIAPEAYLGALLGTSWNSACCSNVLNLSHLVTICVATKSLASELRCT
jgi:hypothetical protein